MAMKDISDRQVCEVVAERNAIPVGSRTTWPYDVLAAETGQPPKVCFRAMERALDRGYLECGVSVRSAWLTDSGWQLLEEGEKRDRELLKGGKPDAD